MVYFEKHANYNKAPRFVRGKGTHDDKAHWKKEFKIVLQSLRGELRKLLFK